MLHNKNVEQDLVIISSINITLIDESAIREKIF